MESVFIFERLLPLIEDYVKSRNLDLIECIHRFEGNLLVLKILADKPEGGISLGECSALNRDICRMIDEQQLIGQPYSIEVCSPGLDRPLKTKSDFLRCLHKEVHIFLNNMWEGKMEWEGLVKSVTETSVSLDVKGIVIEVPLAHINKAKQIF